MPMIARMFRKVPFSDVAARVDRYDDRPAIGMTHHAMASADSHDRETSPLKRPDHLHPRNGREGAGIRPRQESASAHPKGLPRRATLPARPAGRQPRLLPSDHHLPPRRPGAAVQRRTRRRLRPVRRRKAHGLRGSRRRFSHTRSVARIGAPGRTRPAAKSPTRSRRAGPRLVQPDRLGEQDMPPPFSRPFQAAQADQFHIAERLWSPLMSQDAVSAYNLGLLREKQGDLAGAIAAYQVALDSQHFLVARRRRSSSLVARRRRSRSLGARQRR